jgi:uncharacterized membrane protein YedE/YeeE
MSIFAQLLVGLIFGSGLIVSGMIDPSKVLNFLDISGRWDPSLAFVMAGAVTVTAIGYRVIFARKRPVFCPEFHLPAASRIDGRLLSGAAIFGIGWGLSGLCPGPAIAGLGLGAAGVLAFVPSMLVGMAAARFLASRTSQPHNSTLRQPISANQGG